jgi:hypothetical protein
MAGQRIDDLRPSTAAPILAAIAIVALLLPMFYVLGVGPTAWLVIHGYISNDSAMAFYWPLQSLADSSPWVDSILQGYVSLWIGT